MLNLLTLDVKIASKRIKFTAVKTKFISFANRLKRAARYAHDSAATSAASADASEPSSEEPTEKHAHFTVLVKKPQKALTEEEMWHKDRIKEFENALIHLLDGEDIIWYDETVVATDDFEFNARFTELASSPKAIVKLRSIIKAIVKDETNDFKPLGEVEEAPTNFIDQKSSSSGMFDSDIEFNVLSFELAPNSCLDESTLAETPVFMSAVQYEDDVAQSGGTVEGTFSGDNFLEVDIRDERVDREVEHLAQSDTAGFSVNESTERRDGKSPKEACEGIDSKVRPRDEEDPNDAASVIVMNSLQQLPELPVNETRSAESTQRSDSVPLVEKVSAAVEDKRTLSRVSTLPKRRRSRLRRSSNRQKKHRR